MPHLKLSPRATNDIQRLYRFLKPKNNLAAKRAVEAIREQMRMLAHYPELGCFVSTVDKDYREWPVHFGASGYVIQYRIDQDTITVATIRHQREAGD